VAEVYLHGAHVTSWVPAGGEVLFLSRKAAFGRNTPIRGGIPVVFPQFADEGSLPKHGLVRTREWSWLEADSSDQDPVRATLQLEQSPATQAIWPYAFQARLSVGLTEHELTTELAVTNTGEEDFAFTGALHTYFRVADVRGSAILGLGGVAYRDKVTGEHRVESEPSLTISGEVDRIFWNAPPEVRIQDGGGGREIRVRSAGFADVVVWNPWKELARTLPDLDDPEYLEMVCVEAAQIGIPITLPPGEVWCGSQQLQLNR
jgi:glucose-6-phosphate 1-epimerase